MGIKYGFKSITSTYIKECDGVLHEYIYEKNGTRLAWLERADENKSFLIGFRTVPKDDTGVFHILEHSVLNGSQKYPLKEPFVELMKGSLQTFLNAMTAHDYTVYPVSSKNASDYLNLIQVYLDAVFFPLIYDHPEIFYQEGWHYEIKDNESLIDRNGVVLNEMKGEYASENTIIISELKKLLFLGTSAQRDSGGKPDQIPELSYEQFVETHKTYYHPSNSLIVLDGTIDIDSVMFYLDQYLDKFEKREVIEEEINFHNLDYQEVVQKFAVTSEESLENNTTFAYGYRVDAFLSQLEREGLSILADALTSSYEVPLRRAILDKKLGEDISITVENVGKQQFICIQVFNSEQEYQEKVKETIYEVLLEHYHQGIGCDLLTASINHNEFLLRAQDYGSFPHGIGNSINVVEGWFQYQDPIRFLEYEELYSNLRSNLTTNFYENLLKKHILENKNCAQVILVPSITIAEQDFEKEKIELQSMWNHMTVDGKQEIQEIETILSKYQQEDNTIEQISVIPTVKIEEIDSESENYPFAYEERNGIEILNFCENTNGLLYIDLHFNLSILSLREFMLVPLLCEMIGEARTKEHTSYEIQNIIKTHLGSCQAYPKVVEMPKNKNGYSINFVLSVGMIKKEEELAMKIIEEVLKDTIFDDADYIYNVLSQRKFMFEQSFSTNGNSYAQKRVFAQSSVAGVINENLSGYEQYLWIKKQLEIMDHGDSAILSSLQNLLNRIITEGSILASINGETRLNWMDQMTACFPNKRVGVSIPDFELHQKRNEAIVIPGRSGFVYRGWNMAEMGIDYKGFFQPAAKIYSLDYLWKEVRGIVGAYGTGLGVNPYSLIGAYSYRDPNPIRTIEVMAQGVTSLINKIESEGFDLTKYIIGSIAEQDVVRSAHAKSNYATNLFLAGLDESDLNRIRKEILSTKKTDIELFAHRLEQVWEKSSTCIVADEKTVKKMNDDNCVVLYL